MTSFNTIFSSISTTPSRCDKLYLVTNEGKAGDTLKIAKNSPVQEATVVLFASAMFGLNYAAARGANTKIDRRIEHLICVDNSHAIKLFWECLTPIITKSNNRKECIKKIIAMVNKNVDQFYPMDVQVLGQCSKPQWVARCLETWLDNLDDDINDGTSWLSTDQGFLAIQKIFKNNNFAHISGNLFSSDLTQNIVSTLDAMKLKLDSIYLSNIAEVARVNDTIDDYRSAIKVFKTVSTPSTLFIDTCPRANDFGSKERLKQRVRQNFNRTSIEQDIEAAAPKDKSS